MQEKIASTGKRLNFVTFLDQEAELVWTHSIVIHISCTQFFYSYLLYAFLKPKNI